MVQNTVSQQAWSKIDKHSNLSSSVDSTVTDWSRKTIVWTVLNHVVVFQSQSGTSLSNEQFLDNCILTGIPLTAIYFS